MSKYFPRGIFTRHRDDYDVENLMLGSTYVASTGGAGPVAALNNNSTSGCSLAIYAIYAWTTMHPSIIVGGPGGVGNADTTAMVQSLVAGMPAVPGYLSQVAVGGGYVPVPPAQAMIVPREGLYRGGAPLAVIAPGTAWAVWPYFYDDTDTQLGSALMAAFVWGRYS